MRFRLNRKRFDDYEPNPSAKLGKSLDIHRIFNQSDFDEGNDGGCQSAAIFECLEAKIGKDVSMTAMREWYFRMDRFWKGKGEHLETAVKFAEKFGVTTDDMNFAIKDVKKIAPRDISFERVKSACAEFDAVVVAIGTRGSTFFSPMTGKLYKEFSIPGIHGMRVAGDYPTGDLCFQNSWGESWGANGRRS